MVDESIMSPEVDEDGSINADCTHIVVVPKQSKLKWTHYHVSVFLLTFFSYALFHASRKTFSNVKSAMSAQWSPEVDNSSGTAFFPNEIWQSNDLFDRDKSAESFLGWLDFCFLIAYAVGLYICGMLGDRFDPRLVLSAGMVLSAITILFFGYLSEVQHWYYKGYYAFFWLMTGLAQSAGWPSEVCIMGNWFGRSSRGFVLGVWSACASIGNIIGSYLASYFLLYGYEYTFLVNAVLLLLGAVVVFFGLVASPRDVGLPMPGEEDENSESKGLITDEQERPQAIGLLKAILLPGVIAYALAYACLKLVNYSFFFWLPYYLGSAFHWSDADADQLSTWYDWGGIVAGILSGIVTDLMGVRSPIIMLMLLFATVSLYGYSKSPNDKIINSILMALTGFLIGGPANLISSAVSADLGRDPTIRGNAEAVATVTGVLDGTGSVGAALGQLVVPVLDQKFQWSAVFYMFIIMTLLTCVCLATLTYRETKEFAGRMLSKYKHWKSRRPVRSHEYRPVPVEES